MQLGNLDLLWLLVLVPLGVAVGMLRRKRKLRGLQEFADARLLPSLNVPAAEYQSRERRYGVVLAIFLGLTAFSILRPQWGFTWRDGTRRGADIVFAVDVSDSMLAADVSPSRLERVRRKIADLLSLLRGDRVALVSFAGVSFIETPLTLDYRAFRMFLDLINTDLVPVQGSNVEAAIFKSMEALGIKADNPVPPERSSAILLFSDGEELDGDVENAISAAKANKVRIFTLGVGTPEGAPIATPSGYKKDKNGKVVITKLRPELLEKLALETGGLYVQSISSPKDLDVLYRNGMKRLLSTGELKGADQKRWHEYYQLPLAVALLVFIFGPWMELSSRLRRGAEELAGERSVPVITSESALLALLLLVGAPQPANAADPERAAADGKRAFESGKFSDALQHFDAAVADSSGDFRYVMGKGASYYRLNQFDQAEAVFREAVNQAQDNKTKASALYNAGNSLVQAGQYGDAIKTYDESLTLNPDDQEAKDNRAYAKKLLEQQKQQNDKKDNDDKKNDQQKEQSQQNQQQQGGKGDGQSQSESQNSDSQQSHSESANRSQSANEQSGESSSSSADTSPQSGQSSDENKPQPQESKGESSQSSSAQEQPTPGGGGSSESSSSGGKKSEPDESNAQGQPEPQEQESQTPSAADEADDDSTGDMALDALLKGVEEKERSRASYREKKAKEQLRELQRRAPQRDW